MEKVLPGVGHGADGGQQWAKGGECRGGRRGGHRGQPRAHGGHGVVDPTPGTGGPEEDKEGVRLSSLTILPKMISFFRRSRFLPLFPGTLAW